MLKKLLGSHARSRQQLNQRHFAATQLYAKRPAVVGCGVRFAFKRRNVYTPFAIFLAINRGNGQSALFPSVLNGSGQISNRSFLHR